MSSLQCVEDKDFRGVVCLDICRYRLEPHPLGIKGSREGGRDEATGAVEACVCGMRSVSV